MEQNESTYLSNNNTLFNDLKEKCKSRAKFHFYVGLILLFLVFAGVIYCGFHVVRYDFDIRDIVFFLLFTVLCCAVSWFVLNNYRFLHKTGTLHTPDELLYQYDKKIRNDRMFYCLILLVFCGNTFYTSSYGSQHLSTLIVGLAILTVLCALVIYIYFKHGYMSRSDKEIIEQLQELTKK